MRRCGVRKMGGPGLCVRGKMSLSLFSRARMSRSVFGGLAVWYVLS